MLAFAYVCILLTLELFFSLWCDIYLLLLLQYINVNSCICIDIVQHNIKLRPNGNIISHRTAIYVSKIPN